MSQERQHVGFPLLALAVLRLRGHRLLAFALFCATLGWLIWLHPVIDGLRRGWQYQGQRYRNHL